MELKVRSWGDLVVAAALDVVSGIAMNIHPTKQRLARHEGEDAEFVAPDSQYLRPRYLSVRPEMMALQRLWKN